jgi:hypothetical protein
MLFLRSRPAKGLGIAGKVSGDSFWQLAIVIPDANWTSGLQRLGAPDERFLEKTR